jgi:hypothetical protein
MEGIYLNIIKAADDKPIPKIGQSEEKLKPFPLK